MRAAAWHVQDVKHHPASVDLELIKRLLATTKCKTLQQFLAREFSSISKDYAGVVSSPMALSSSSPYCTASPLHHAVIRCTGGAKHAMLPASESSAPKKGG